MGFAMLLRPVRVEAGETAETVIPWNSADWEYTETETSVTLKKYIGDSNDVLVPSVANSKPVTLKLSAIDEVEDRVNSITFATNVNVVDKCLCYTMVESDTVPNGVTMLVNDRIEDSKSFIEAYWIGSIVDDTYVATQYINTAPAAELIFPGYVKGGLPFVIGNGFKVAQRNITSVDFEEGVQSETGSMYNMFSAFNKITTIGDIPDCITNTALMCNYCSNLTTIGNLPTNLYDMSTMFYSCTKLTSVGSIPNATMMRSSFWGCTNLVNAPAIPEGAKYISSVFRNCNKLRNSPELPDSVLDMSYAFAGCTNLRNVSEWPANVTNIANAYFGCSNITTVPELPEGCTIGGYNIDSVFAQCVNLTKGINFPSTCNRFFATYTNCQKLETVPNFVDGADAFNQTFYNCRNLTQAPNFPSTANYFYKVFANCTNLTGDIYINSTIVRSFGNMFDGSDLPKTIHIPAGVHNTYNVVMPYNGKNGITVVQDL